MKKIVALLLVAVLAIGMLAGCGGSKGGDEKGGKTLKVGAILVGDETEGYSLAHMDGMEKAIEELKAEGINVELSYKKKVPESDEVGTNAKDLIADGCTVIITNSYGHQFYLDDVIAENPEVQFTAMTGDLAATTTFKNYSNAFTKVFESRFASGVVAGLKIQELIDAGKLSPEVLPSAYDADGKIKIGYIGAFAYAEVVSGYTAFFLGIKSVVGDTVAMTVKYTNSWFSEEREAAVGEYLCDQGCVIIGQHADSTGGPAAIQARHNQNPDLVCFSVGYNVSMLDAAPDVALTSASNNWNIYYKLLFKNAANGEAIPQNWSAGYADDAVCITELGKAAPEGAAAKVDEVVAKIKDGSLKVFDCSTFTVGGANITSYDQSYGFEGNECIKSENGVSFFDESSLRSAPYFDLRIDGITEIASDYTD